MAQKIQFINNSFNWIWQLFASIFWRLLASLGVLSSSNTIVDQIQDHIAPFDEYPNCEMCGCKVVTERLVTKDGCHIVECNECGLWFTSPRINEGIWIEYLKTPTKRSIEFTENRLRFGVALSSRIKFVPPMWRSIRKRKMNALIDELGKHAEGRIKRLHDVGCGVGFLLQVAKERGIEVSGNEINGYACQVMRDRLGFTVYNNTLPNLNIEDNTLDAIIFRDYIEHTYHPLADLKTAHKFLRPDGLIYVETFHVDCYAFDRWGKDWNMLFWNHAFHFSKKTLKDMMIKAGFDIIDIKKGNYENILIEIIAKKA